MALKTRHREPDSSVEFPEKCQRIREIAANGQLKDAIDQLKDIIRSGNTQARTECDVLSYRLADAEKRELAASLTWDQALAERNKITTRFFEFISELEGRPAQQSRLIVSWTRRNRRHDVNTLIW